MKIFNINFKKKLDLQNFDAVQHISQIINLEMLRYFFYVPPTLKVTILFGSYVELCSEVKMTIKKNVFFTQK